MGAASHGVGRTLEKGRAGHGPGWCRPVTTRPSSRVFACWGVWMWGTESLEMISSISIPRGNVNRVLSRDGTGTPLPNLPRLEGGLVCWCVTKEGAIPSPNQRD